MFRARISRMGAIVTASLVAAQLLAGAVSAAPPRWSMTVDRLPETVANGASAGFRITITNSGPSNISQLYMTDSPIVAPSYIGLPSQGSCTQSGDLLCTFGALGKGDSVIVTVAYVTPDSGATYDYTALADTTGVAFDAGDNSHGDTLTKTVTTTLRGDSNFGGGFVPDQLGSVSNGAVDGTNKQSTKLENLPITTLATVEDGPTVSFPCKGCGKGVTEWSKITVNSGQTFTAPFKVVITTAGSFSRLDLSKVVVYHVLDNGTVVVIGDTATERCASATDPGTVPADGCVFPALVGGNLQLTVYVYQNGGMRF